MANSIQGMRIIFDMVKLYRDNNNPLTEDKIKEFVNNLIPDDNKNHIERFFEGYYIEEFFRLVFSQLPWVKLITPLGQEQYPEKSKEEYQIPDYKVLFEYGCLQDDYNILIEVKYVKFSKDTFKLPKFLYNVLKKYSVSDKNTPLLFALYWGKYNVWTINSIESFRELSSTYKINFKEAYLSDLSSIFGDYFYVFNKQVYRKTICSNNCRVEEYCHTYKDYGNILYEGFAVENNEYEKFPNSIYTIILDNLLKFSQIQETIMDNGEIEIIEKLETKFSQKFTTFLIRFWTDTGIRETDNYIKTLYLTKDKESFDLIDGLRVALGGERYYIIPNCRNGQYEDLFKLQFSNTHIYKAFSELQPVDNEFLIIPNNISPKIL